MVPEIIPGKERGTVIVQNILRSDTPRVLAALIILLSICSKADRVVLYIIGKDTTIAAITVACHENIICIPKEKSNEPIGLFFPNISNNKKPRTVGGSTIGIVNKASKKHVNLLNLLHNNFAVKIPIKKVIKVENNDVLIDIHNGE
jgi:hypothetical protein